MTIDSSLPNSTATSSDASRIKGTDAWTNVITHSSYRQVNETYASCIIRQEVNVAHGSWFSVEFFQHHPAVLGAGGINNAAFARLCHALYLQRKPSPADQNFWTTHLDGSGDYDGTLKAFLCMDEYRTRAPNKTPILG